MAALIVDILTFYKEADQRKFEDLRLERSNLLARRRKLNSKLELAKIHHDHVASKKFDGPEHRDSTAAVNDLLIELIENEDLINNYETAIDEVIRRLN